MDRRLEVLGGFALLAGGAARPLTSRKAQALMGLLGMARGGRMPRARLAALLWGASGEEHARTSLRQCLAQIRRAGGEGWVEADGDALVLGPGVAVDAAEMRAAAGRGDHAGAARIWRGEFLEGAHFPEPALEEAVQAERAALRGIAAGALRSELERMAGPDAAVVAHRLLALDPLSEPAHRALMEADALAGARDAALARFSRLEAALRRDLDAAPEEETRALAARIRSGRTRRTAPGAPAGTPSRTASAPVGAVAVLAAMEAEGTPDWDALAGAARGTGAEPQDAAPGEALFLWSGREAAPLPLASLALERAGAAGATLSFGLLTGEGEPGPLLRRARRLAAGAAPGTVAVPEALARRLGLDPARAAPAGPGAVRLEAAPSRRPELPLAGRQAELAQIAAAAGAARMAGEGLVVHLSGEAGIGKTRLAAEVADRLSADGVRALAVGFEAFGAGTSHIAQRIAALLPPLPVPDGPHDRAVRSWLAGEAADAETELRLSVMSEAGRQRRVTAMLAEALGALPEGTLLAVEDVHWAPRAAGDWLLELADRLAPHPVILLLTERPHEASLGPRLGARGRIAAIRIALAPLAARDAAALAAAAAPGADAAPAVERAAGHPLFLLRLLESGWRDGALPDSVTGLVSEQIERLDPDRRDALRRASVLGRRFDPADLAAIFPGRPVPAPTGDLVIATGEGLAFGHDLIHRAVYDAIPAETRAGWHAAAAAHFRVADPVRRADHALRASDDGEASRAAAAAANAMIAGRRFAAAQPYVEAGLARAGDPEAVAELHSCRAGVRRMRGDLAGALDDYRAAYSAAIAETTRAAMLIRQALVLHRLDRGGEADRALEEAELIADRVGLAGLVRAEIHEQRGNRAFVRGDYADCLRHHRAGLEAAEAAGDPRGLARAHGGLGDAHFAAGRIATAHRHFDRALEIAAEAGLGVVHEEFGFMRAYSHFFAEPGPRAHLLADLAVESAVGSGAGRAEMVARETRAEMRLAALDLAGAREDIDRLAALLVHDPESRFAADLVALTAWLALREGDGRAAFAGLEPHLEAAADEPYNGAVFLSLAALAAPDEAVRDRVLRVGAERLRAGALSCAGLWFHAFTLERHLRDGEREAAAARIVSLRTLTAGEPLGFADHVAAAGEAALSGSGAVAASVGRALADARLGSFAAMLGPGAA